MTSEEILEIIDNRIDHFNRHYRFDFYGIRIKKMKTRWGSCSSKKNLNFNAKIVTLPDRLIDYIVVHELCHLQELNHSPRFWALVAQSLPDYEELKKELRKILIKSKISQIKDSLSLVEENLPSDFPVFSESRILRDAIYKNIESCACFSTCINF